MTILDRVGSPESLRLGRRSALEVRQLPQVTASSYFRWKRGLDYLWAALLLLPALPVIGILICLVRLTSRGPGIYRQVRVVKSGQTFLIYKIRSMTVDAENVSGAVWAQRNDPRVTAVGRILRQFHLDELPQLFNVLRGEMSLCGPRPERPEFVHSLARKIPGYADRLAVLPGITGLAQLNLPPDSDLQSVRRKLYLDLQYVECAGWFLDMRLLLCTAGRLFKLYEPLLLWVLGLYRRLPEDLAVGAGCESAEETALRADHSHRRPVPKPR